jgi:RNA polymerase sigma-70 factor (ECF subfamily)
VTTLERTSDEGRRPSDEVLAARVARGDRSAFSVLYDRYERTVYTFAAHVLGAAQAEEVVQDVFLALWRKAARFDPRRAPFAAWFMSVARHRIVDELRRRSVEQRFVVLDPIDEVLAGPASAADTEEEAALRAQGGALLGALRALPDEQRLALVLVYFGGFTHVEAAAALGWPLGTVKKRLQLGLRKLHAALAEMGPVAETVRTERRR